MDVDLLKTMRRDMRPPAASSAELGERRGWNAALDAVAAALATAAPTALTEQPGTERYCHERIALEAIADRLHGSMVSIGHDIGVIVAEAINKPPTPSAAAPAAPSSELGWKRIKIPTETMEQEFQSHYRRGFEAGKLAASLEVSKPNPTSKPSVTKPE